MKILIADDDEVFRNVLFSIISVYSNKRFAFLFANDGAEALAKALEHRPNVIITDYSMPHKNGLEFLEGLKKSLLKPLLTIFSSGNMTPEIEMTAISLGAHFCLDKVALTKKIVPILEEALP